MPDFRNTLTNNDAMVCLAAFIEILEKYESVIIKVSSGNVSKNTIQEATAALNFGRELVDGEP